MDDCIATIERAVEDSTSDGLLLLNEWKASENAMMIACEVFYRDCSPKAKFIAAIIFIDVVMNTWEKIPPEQKVTIRDLLASQLSQNPIEIGEKLIICLAKIVLLDGVDDWDVSSILIHPTDGDGSILMAFLAGTLEELDRSKEITENRRQRLRGYFRRHYDIVAPRIYAGMMDDSVAMWALKAYRYYLPLISLRGQSQFLNALLTRFAAVEESREMAVECLNIMFFKHTDCTQMFQGSYSVMLEFFIRGTQTGGSPIVSDFQVAMFMIEFMKNYFHKIVKIQHRTDILEGLVQVINILLSLPQEIISESDDYWTFWSVNCCSAVDDMFRGGTSALYRIITSKISQIRETLFRSLEYSTDENGLVKDNVLRCYAKISELDYPGMMQFLAGDQMPSPSLCYAVGSLMMVRVPPNELVGMTPCIQMLIEKGVSDLREGTNPTYVAALLFGLSRAAVFLRASDLLDQYLDLAIACSQVEAVANTVAYSLEYLTRNHMDVFTDIQGDSIVGTLAASSENYISYMDDDACAAVYTALIRLITKNESSEAVMPLLEQLWGPVLVSISQPCDYTYKCLILIKHIASDDTNTIPVLGTILWPDEGGPLSHLITQVIPSCSEEFVEIVLNATSALLCGCPWPVAEPRMKFTLDTCLQRSNCLACFFTFLTSLRKTFGTDMNAYAEPIFGSFLAPLFGVADAPITEMLELITAFEYVPGMGIEWVLSIAGPCIMTDNNTDLNKAIIRCLLRHFREMGGQDFTRLMHENAANLMAAIFTALTDAMHKDVASKYARFVLKVFWFMFNRRPSTDEWKQLLWQVLSSLNPEPREGFYVEFITCLDTAQARTDPDEAKKQFTRLITEFLIMLNKVSPGDMDVSLARDHTRGGMFDFEFI